MRVAVGDKDPFFPFAKLKEACRAKLHQEVVVVPSAGHLLVDEAPELVADLAASLT